MHTDEYEAKHETHLIHDGSPSYDPGVYGGTYPHRFHIKTVQVRSIQVLLERAAPGGCRGRSMPEVRRPPARCVGQERCKG